MRLKTGSDLMSLSCSDNGISRRKFKDQTNSFSNFFVERQSMPDFVLRVWHVPTANNREW
jgi:hypothetical protein